SFGVRRKLNPGALKLNRSAPVKALKSPEPGLFGSNTGTLPAPSFRTPSFRVTSAKSKFGPRMNRPCGVNEEQREPGTSQLVASGLGNADRDRLAVSTPRSST